MDDHELEKQDTAAPRSSLFGRGEWLVVLVALAVVGGGGAWWWTHRQAGPPPPPIVAPVRVDPPPAPAPEAVQVVSADRQRDLMEAVSANASFRAWLGRGELLERWAVTTDNLAEGVSPRARLRFLAPRGEFKTVRRGDREAIAPSSYARYDLVAEVVGSVDVAAAVHAYRELHGLLESAYRAIGYPEGSLDRVTARALQRLAAAPARDGDVFVEAGGPGPGALYIFSAVELERLGPVEKQLLRMGPRNTRIIQAKARQLERALGLPPAGAR
jgi:hypothetical protein